LGKSVSEGRTTDEGYRPPPGLEPADERLLTDLRRRAPDSLDRLHGLYAVGIFNLALRMVHQRQDAEDITHDVLIRAYERLPRDREVRLRPWLYRMTLNRCYDHLRAAARRRPVDPERHDCDVAAPGDPFEQAELSALFERTLETMSTRQQAALLLKDVHGFSTAELAVMLEVTPGSAEVLLARARTSFRGRFADMAGVEPRAVPAWIGASLVLPLVALPTALLKPPLPPAPFHPLPDLSHVALGAGYAAPVGAAGGGLGSLMANSAALKMAAVLAAAATMSVGVSDAHHHLAYRAPSAARPAAAATARATSAQVGTAALARGPKQTPRPTPDTTLAASTTAASPSPTASASTSSSPTPSPTPTGSQLGDTGYTPPPTGSPSPTPTPTPSVTASDAPTASPSASPSPSAEPTDDESPTPTASPSDD
jgi:RNA polymerase sigma factor (sigma-70 family)